MAFIEASLEELPVSANLGQSCLATTISAPGPSSFGWFRHSEVLSETKTRYPQIQKLLYAVVLARRKLRHYFETHPLNVVLSFPLGEIVHNREAEGRIVKWSVELMGETLTYAPRKAIKSQILADFVA